MKKLICLMIVAALMLCAAGATADTIRFVEDSRDFDIEMALPEGAVVGSKTGSELVSIVEIAKEGLAPVRISIAPSDIYEKLSLSDLSEAEIDELKLIAGMQYENPELSVEVTPSGNSFIHVCANSEYDVDSIFTLYMGYFVELTQWRADYAELSEADYGFMLELLYNIEFLPL